MAVSLGRRTAAKPVIDIAQEIDNRLAQYEPIAFPSFSTSIKQNSSENDAKTPANAALTTQRGNKVKTSHVLIFLCLHIGNDPPDYVRIEPCAKLECWTDPVVAQVKCMSRGSEGVADTLEQQYRLIQKDAMYKKLVEVTIDDAKQQLQAMRRKARDGRILFHYNGHGMPRATHLGELWFFDKDRTHYVPMNINEIASYLDSPAIYVLDCNSAGSVLNHWQRADNSNRNRDFMICACGDGEMLPMNPLLPADILTSCLTTPIKMLLEWYISYSYRRTLLPNVTEDMIRHIPGDLSDRKTPLGELNWIFTAVTDTIAWCTTPSHQFHQLFRQDVVIKSLFRNYLLAEKLLREVGCTPVTYPPLPDTTYSHYMWDAWEIVMESIICQLPNLLNSDMSVNSLYTYVPTTFFCDQLTAFEVWVEEGDPMELPEQLPCVILALTQISHRVRSLTLLSKYLSTGPTAVHNAVLCGVLLYITKLLISTPEVFLLVTIVWSQIVAVDPTAACQELIKNQAEKHFIRLLQIDEEKVVLMREQELHSTNVSPVAEDTPTFYDVEGVSVDRCKSAACFALCKLLDAGGEKLYVSCWNQSILRATFPLLSHKCATLRSWGCLLLSKMFLGLRAAKEFACKEYTSRINLFSNLLHDKYPGVRSSCATLLSTLLGTRVDLVGDEAQQLRRIEADKTILIKLRSTLFDHSASVRQELAFGCAQILYHYGPLVSRCSLTDSILGVVVDTHADWELQEPAVQVKSSLSSNRPTDNILFDDSIQFNTTFLGKDDPAPATPWDARVIAPRVMQTINGLVHDASAILNILYRNSDQALCTQVLQHIEANVRVTSFRLHAETTKMALDGIAALTSSSSSLSEEDRAQRSRNRDLMRKLLLDIQGRKFEAPGGAAASPSGSSPATPSSTGSQAFAPILGTSGGPTDSSSKPIFTQVNCFPQPHDQIACGQFRLLEPQVIFAERNNRISIVDYESHDTPTVVMQIAHPGSVPIHDLMLINDLSTDPGLVVLNKVGGFTVYRGIGDPRVAPQEACSFAACSATGVVDLHCGYRADGHLLYAGPTSITASSSNEMITHKNELTVVNLMEEQVVQRIAISGEAQVTCLAMHPTSRCVLLGMSDSVVRYFDDRTKQGQLAAISTLQRKGALPCTAADAIIGISVGEDGSTGSINVTACTTNSLRLYDLRQPAQPLRIVELSPTAAASPLSSVAAKGVLAPARQGPIGVSSFAGSLYTNLSCAAFTDGSCEIYNAKGVSVLSKSLKVKDAACASCFMHPLRPMAFFAGELVALV